MRATNAELDKRGGRGRSSAKGGVIPNLLGGVCRPRGAVANELEDILNHDRDDL